VKKFALRAMFGIWIAAAPFALVGCDEPKPAADKAAPAAGPAPGPVAKKPDDAAKKP
jgi:hypothetical protein